MPLSTNLLFIHLNKLFLGDPTLPEEYTDIIKATNPTKEAGKTVGTFLKVSPERQFDENR